MAIETIASEELLTISGGLIGSVVAAVLPTTRDLFEPTVRYMELCQEIVKEQGGMLR